MIADALSSDSYPSSQFTRAHARLTSARARMISSGMRSQEMSNNSSERCVYAPHSRSAGTSIEPNESRSVRVVLIARLTPR